jgi:hypothetical protein
LLEVALGQPEDAAVPDMEDVRRSSFEDHRAQRADVALVLEEPVAAALGMKPGIGRADHAFAGGLCRPGIRGAVVVCQEACDGYLGRDLAHLAR